MVAVIIVLFVLVEIKCLGQKLAVFALNISIVIVILPYV